MPHFWMDSEFKESGVTFLTPNGYANLMGGTKLSIYKYLDKELTTGSHIEYLGEFSEEEVYISMESNNTKKEAKTEYQTQKNVWAAIANTGFDEEPEITLSTNRSVEISEEDVKFLSSVGMSWFVWKGSM